MQDLFDLNQQHLVGKLIHAPKGNCALGQLSVPLAKDVLVLSAVDLQHTDMQILGDLYPVLAGNIVKYDNQPILAVFGPDFESVELYSRQIEIGYLPIDTPQETAVVRKTHRTFGKSYDQVEGTEFESNLTYYPHSESTISGQRVHAVFKDGKIHIKCVSQWPMHIKQQVASELGLNMSDVLVYPQEFFASNDQLVYQPTITSILASVAAVKTKKLVELSVPMVSRQPELKFRLLTKTNPEGIPIAHKAMVEADMGVYPVFASEYCNSLIAGLVPSYPVQSLEMDACAVSSANPPACFFKDLGHSMAVSATEVHFNKLASSLGKNPAKFREEMFTRENRSELSIKKQIIESPLSDRLPQTVKACVADSVFERLYAANNQKGVHQNINYARGIGISCGEGTQGFSYQFPYLKDYSVSVTLDGLGNVTVSQALQTSETNKEIWRNVVAKCLDIDPQRVSFLSINEPGVVDNGPSVLSRSSSFMANLLEKTCEDLKSNENGTYPVTATRSIDVPEGNLLYSSYCNGTVIVSLHVDYVTLMPVVDNVTARLAFGKVLNLQGLKSHLRQMIISTIAELCPDVNQNFKIDLKLASDQSKPLGGADSLVRGLTASSFLSALCQALGRNIEKMPVTQKDMFEMTMKKTESKEEKDENKSDN